MECASHSLGIEVGREVGSWTNIPLEERLCILRSMGRIEDEDDFAFQSDRYAHVREDFNSLSVDGEGDLIGF